MPIDNQLSPCAKHGRDTEEAMKADSDKIRTDLLPPYSLMEIAKVFTFGAKKYKKYTKLNIIGIFDLCKKQNILKDKPRVTQISLISPEDYVETVTENGIMKTTLSMLKDRKNLSKSGEWTTEKIFSEKKKSETRIQNANLNIPNLKEELDWERWESHLVSTRNSAKKDVRFAKEKNIYTLTMTIKQENSEEYFAVNATTDSECLEILLRELKKLSIISEQTNLNSEKEGSWNYMEKGGLKTSRVYGALLRHMFSWFRGESIDPESGESHLAHAGCCIMMLIELDKFGKNKDKPNHYNES